MTTSPHSPLPVPPPAVVSAQAGVAREHGILFSAPMVRALLAGTKVQTRRIMKPQPPTQREVIAKSGSEFSVFTDRHSPGVFRVGGPVWAVRELMGREPQWTCPYGAPGDILWVRETWSHSARGVYPCPSAWRRADFTKYDDPALNADHIRGCGGNQGDCFACAAEREGKFRWRPAIFMKRADSRITLKVTGVRVERVQDISEEDARAEGVTLDPVLGRLNGAPATLHPFTHRQAYIWLWDAINGAGSWASNPWVWVVGFRRVTP